ncbi:YbaB/EbfC family nucleoid-associated protein [Nocardia cyriacigeorgica]|uniref:YbaB/EbfC family nucleoid-associated protein n=1 Tax=Nocardia cyriacigeorgica TaxID=135487 RepID=UPI001892ED9A|nr:YbaB/EbfC family nucleoid-associated protein [Nocardia cyriacigeorgica]MBF6317480.1 YbaB/EbfC family nucleoid-associated protein [Nocardia cyriacigeorgica]MBF6531968.1 YbaB/EbfC family nucleoid-associated protein [Nocardia cyriacigeorgica]
MSDELDEQRACVPEAFAELARARCEARSADGLVRITVDGRGALTDVHLDPAALKAGAEQLGRVLTEVGRQAARRAAELTREIAAPLLAPGETMPDLPELVPGAPSLIELFDAGSPDHTGDAQTRT